MSTHHLELRKTIMLDLGLRAEAFSSVQKYIELLWASNEELNLISRKMVIEELIDNHLIDCLLPLEYFPKALHRVADFGSGGGLPGVIYAIQFPETEFHLYEKSHHKREFLAKCKVIAPNIVIHAEIPIQLEVPELVMARAFKPIDVILDLSRKYQAQGGRYFLLKGRREKIDEELALARRKFKSVQPKIISLKSPVMEVERNLVLI